MAQEIKAGGEHSESAKADALNESEIDNFLKKVVSDNGKPDIVFNGIAVEYSEMGGHPPTTLATFEQFMAPMEKICGSQFLTSRVAAKYMIETQSEGTILLLTAALSRSKIPNLAGITVWRRGYKGDLYLPRRLNGDSSDLRVDRCCGKTVRNTRGAVCCTVAPGPR